MSASIIERFRRWFEYEKDAHAKVVRSLESVPKEGRTIPEFQRAVGILAHIAAARHIWLYRLGVLPSPPAAMFPENPDLSQVKTALDEIHAHWSAYLSRITDADLELTFQYQSLDAGRFQNRIEDILTQLFGHSWYHRGQIAMLVRIAGGEPAITDFIYWCREPIEPAGS